MLKTYSAMLENNQLHWINEAPERQNPDHPVMVLVTIMKEVSANDLAAKKEKLLTAMLRMAKCNGLSAITDPVA